MSPPIAAIDVGTHSFHIVIASADFRGNLRIYTRKRKVVRLGSSGGDMKYIEPEAAERGIEALKGFATMAREAKAAVTRAVATSAVREALNKTEFLNRVRQETGIHVEVISGIEEGRLIYLGALSGLPILHKRALVIDIGGGSTETVIGYGGDPVFVHSIKLGAIRLTKRFFHEDSVTNERVRLCREYIKGEWSPTFQSLLGHGFETVVGTSGTIHALAAMALVAKGKEVPDLINDLPVSREELLSAIEAVLKAPSRRHRQSLPGMDPSRADIIPAGALILEQAILGLNIRDVVVSGSALREGLLFDTIEKQKNLQAHHSLSHLRSETVHQMCERYKVRKAHTEHVRDMALQLFDDLEPLHKLNYTEREFLEAAALLHDVGHYISSDQHHKHSYYIIRNSAMPGFTDEEAELIANIARYHRKSHPKETHDNFQQLSSEWRSVVRLLAGMLRIAEGLDRRQLQAVRRVHAVCKESSIELHLLANLPSTIPDIELWSAQHRKGLLEEALGKRIVVFLDETCGGCRKTNFALKVNGALSSCHRPKAE